MPKKSLGKLKKANRPDFLEGEFSLPKLEENVLKFWEEQQIFEKSVETTGKKKKEFHKQIFWRFLGKKCKKMAF